MIKLKDFKDNGSSVWIKGSESRGKGFMAGLSIVVPTLNEADNIDPLFERIFSAKIPEHVSLQIIVVDDGSIDETRPRVQNWTSRKPVKLVCREKNDGLASAVIEGAKAADHEIVLVIDADLSHPPEKIADMIQPLLDGQCDMVIGSRYVDQGATPEWPVTRKIASKLASLPAYLFTDAKDPMAGFFATTRQRLIDLRPDVPGFKIGFELLAVGGSKLRVQEVPIVFQDRFEGFSKMNKTVIFEYFKQVVQLSGFDSKNFTPARLLTLTVLGILIDTLMFSCLTTLKYEPVTAHLVSILLSTVILFYSLYRFWKGTDVSREIRSVHLLVGFVSMITAASLQGAVYLIVGRLQLLNEVTALGCGSIIGISWFIGLMTVYGFSGFDGLENRVKLRIIAVGLILFSIILRLFYLGLPELMEQEAYYWNYSNHLDISYLDHPPMVATLIWLGTALFGVSEFGVRIAAFCCWFVIALFVYRLTAKLFDRTAALGSVVLVAWLPVYYGAGLMLTPDAPLIAAWSALIYYFYLALVQGRSEAWKWVGISLGLGMISKYTIVLLGPAVFCFMLVDRKARRCFYEPGPYVAVALALLIFLPVLIWNYQHDWASFLFQGQQRVTGETSFTTHRLGGYITLILTPAGVMAAFYFLFRGNTFFINVGKIWNSRDGKSIDRSFVFLLLMTLSPLLIFLVFSLSREVKLNWTAPLWLSVLPLLGCTVMSVYGDIQSKFLSLIHWLWMPTILIIVLIMPVAMHYVTLGIPGVSHPPGPFLLGWSELAGDVEQLVDRVEQETGNRPVVIGMDPYQISSGLAFYRTKNLIKNSSADKYRGIRETVGWHLFGWNALMYQYWSDPADYRNRNIIVVASSKKRVESAYFQKRVKRENPPFSLYAKKDGQEVRRFYIRQIYDYRPRPFKKL